MKTNPIDRPMRPFRACLRLGVCLLAVSLLLGCGSKGNEKVGTVTGKVTVGGKSPGGRELTVMFIGADNKPTYASITNTGTFAAADVPVGTTKVTLTGKKAPPAGSLSPGASPVPEGPPIPAKYASPGNGLTYTVKPGEQTFDIELQP
jgi:hypothetical protein